jgi:hypothetical protein
MATVKLRTALAVRGNYAFVGVGLRLIVLDVTNPVTLSEGARIYQRTAVQSFGSRRSSGWERIGER